MDISELLMTSNTHIEKRCADLISQLLQIEPSKRPTSKQVLNHPLFDDLDKVGIENEMKKSN